jgi:tRNA/rRNA methyltransferase
MLERADRLRVVLVGTRNPLNIGAAARAMSNFGFLHLRVVSPYDVAFREARSAVGAASLLANAEEYKTVADAVADCTLVVGTTAVRHRELHHPLRRLEQGARLIRKELGRARVALLFGTEKTGLSNDDLSHCHWLMRIPTREQHISMNLGQAVAVCLYELMRNAKQASTAVNKMTSSTPGPKGATLNAKRGSTSGQKRERATGSPSSAGFALDGVRATAGEVERISTVLLEALHLSGYINPIAATSTEERVRRMVRRLELSSHDAELWLGMLRQMLWKIRAGAKSQS